MPDTENKKMIYNYLLHSSGTKEAHTPPLESYSAASSNKLDILFRLQTASTPTTNRYSLKIAPTSAVTSRFWQLIEHKNFELRVLSGVVSAQKRMLDYSSLYAAFLLEQLSEEEFVEETQNFVIQPENLSDDELAQKLKVLFDCNGLDFTVSDLADIFSVDEAHVRNAMERVKNDNDWYQLK